jgi:arginine N-succinyltransferase
MLVLRPIRESDLPGLVALAQATGGGLTTLPPDESFLADRIDESLRAFRPRVRRPGGEYYLFALEDSASRELIGVSGIASRVGGFDPWYSYEIKVERHAHPPLDITRDIPVLHLNKEHRGPSEVCSLFLRPDRRHGGAGRLLSLARFLFMGAHRERFTSTVIAEMRGYIDQTQRSPFWEAVGRHFFEFDFYRADVLCGLGEKEFITDLMPRHPIYVPLLPADVQAVIGRVHHETEPALAILLSQGFAPSGQIDIFDAGPLLRGTIATLKIVSETRTATLRHAVAVPAATLPRLILANPRLDFRACIGPAITHEDETVSLTRETTHALGLEEGDPVALAPLK